MSNRTRASWRISALLTALSLVLPFVILLLVAPVNPDALLPACCKRDGKHQCAMRMMEDGSAASSSAPHLARLVEKCPYAPGVVPGATNPLLWHPAGQFTTALIQSSRRIVGWNRYAPELHQESANLKRGPPAFHISA